VDLECPLLISVINRYDWITGEPRFNTWWGQIYSLCYVFLTGCGAHTASYIMGEGTCVPKPEAAQE
jgi:hypothetical protein